MLARFRFCISLASALCGAAACARDWPTGLWRHFDGDHLLRVALPMGGIGCGAVSLSGRGELVDWEIMNRPNKELANNELVARSFFAIRVKGASHDSTTMLAGQVHPVELYGQDGARAPGSGMPRFRNATFDGAFPFGVVHLSDPDLPVKVDVKGFSPFVPGDSDASSLPVAALEYEVENLSGEPLEVSILAFVRNIPGNDANNFGVEQKNTAEYREENGLRALVCRAGGVPRGHVAWGSLALSTPDRDGSLTWRDRLLHWGWQKTALELWEDFSSDGELAPTPPRADDVRHCAMALKKAVPPGRKTVWKWYFTWHFPNGAAWLDYYKKTTVIGNWYGRLYADAWDAAKKIVPRMDELKGKSLAFTTKILSLDAPAAIKEAALANLAVLKSQTVMRLPSGHLVGWEGVNAHKGSCHGSCTHVWNYENAVACLFPDLARTMRDVEFNYSTDPATGAMDHRAELPLGSRRTLSPAADGQMGCIMKAYRDWRICGDDSWLKGIWPNVKNALAFSWDCPDDFKWNADWCKGGWDAGKTGLIYGEQANTMDVKYYGPNPQMGFWYLGALRAAEEMAKAVGDGAFAAECREVFERGSARIDAELFNGEYYVHKITEGHGELVHQLGEGCLIDQLVGQQMAHLWDLGDLAKKEHLKSACESIMRYNFKSAFFRHFNHRRNFCVGDDAGTVMGAYPRSKPKWPFPYFNEVMTGFEYVAAAEMIFQGMDADALKVVRAVRDRHDGLKRNPFSEPECGHNYARSMASWNCLLAWLKMHGGNVRDVIWK